MVGAVSGHAAAAVQLQAFVSGLVNPLDLQSAKDGSGRLFAVEQRGAIRIIKAGKIMATPFLNVSGIIESGGEKGLLGLAFHPSYKTNRRFFVNYTRRVNGQLKTFIVEYRASISNPNVADVTTRKEILVVNQPFDNHNGGQLAFGPDGYLYIGLGDGGSQGDPPRQRTEPGPTARQDAADRYQLGPALYHSRRQPVCWPDR